AIFHTAGVIKWGSDPETGNFVLEGQKAVVTNIYDRRTVPGSLCQFSYALDTHSDKSIWAAQKAFEDYVITVAGFNKGSKDRRTWQDGTGADRPNSYYVFSSQVFVKRVGVTKHREANIDYELHPWIAAVTKGPKTEYFANPDRPKLLEPYGGKLRNIKDSDSPQLKKGDVVWISFSVSFLLGGDTWTTNFTPFEIIRVGAVSADLIGDAADRP
ncbi:uncharacterized protein TRAVEDRAFT_87590, partial [Trametes versicolor FP-101664 SS1]|uniref:uncharacterized protein n=1 Tax=Trametes versicolor (strain FP-101664) TaxID=717944 RepID=UPI0004622E2E